MILLMGALACGMSKYVGKLTNIACWHHLIIFLSQLQ